MSTRSPTRYGEQPLGGAGAGSQRSFVRSAGRAVVGFFGGAAGLSAEQIGINPNSIAPGIAHGAGLAANFLGRAGGEGAGLAARAGGEGFNVLGSMRRAGKTYQRNARRYRRVADSMHGKMKAGTYAYPKHTESRAQHLNKWGKDMDPKSHSFGFRKFGARSAGEHIDKAAHNIFNRKFGMFSKLSIGLNVGMAAFSSDDNIFDPVNGMARHVATNAAAEFGAIAGGGLGAAMGEALIGGGIAAGIGMAGGLMLGSMAASAAAELPWKISAFGNQYGRLAATRKSSFLDSEQASTMRQRAMQSISRSQMNARSAFGQEAMALHM